MSHNGRVIAMNNEKSSSPDATSSSSSLSSLSSLSSSSQVMNMLLDMNGPTPGFTNQSPLNTTDRSQKELIKLVLTIVITWMSVDRKLKQIWGNNEDKTSNNNNLINEAGILKMDILKKGRGKEVNIHSSTVNFDYKILYNGLNIDQESDINLTMSSEYMIPLGFRSMLLGMKAGERRRALMTSNAAFSSSNIPDIIAEDGTVIVEIDCKNVV